MCKEVGYVTHEIAMMGLASNGVELPQMYLYSGGLGTLAGAIARAARNLDVPITAFSILARYGYYDQTIYEQDGTLHMGVELIRREYNDMLGYTGIIVPVDISGKTNYSKIWKLPSEVFGTVPVYLHDTDIDENGKIEKWTDENGITREYVPIERENTRYLYAGPSRVGGNDERQIAQDMILGIGAVRINEKLNLGIELWQMNESHTVFTALELLRKELPEKVVLEALPQKEKWGLYSEAILRVKQKAIYTNHTPDPAGNKRYDLGMFTRMYRDLPYELVEFLGDDGMSPPGFNLGVACLRLSRIANAVSKKHLEVTKAMFSGVKDGGAPIISITNGCLQKDFFQDPMFTNSHTWEEIAHGKMVGKRRLNEFLRGYTGKEIDINIPVFVWARRFAQYKRPDLLLKYSRDWLLEHLTKKSFTLIIAGKPHPDDHDMVSAWTNLLRLSREYPNLIMVPNYDMRICKILNIGADVWLNTPRVGMEASGTSGMKGNGAINVSVIDGWMCEADTNNFFAFGTQFPSANMDVYDANSLTKTLDERVLNTYYNDPEGWFKMALRAKFEYEKNFNAERMMQEYVEKMYF
jgi:starch phosphorylase